MHVKHKVTHTYTVTVDGREFETSREPFDYCDPILRQLPDGRSVLGYLERDDDPHNPREDDQLGVMVCWHSRYKLGDPHKYENVEAFWQSLLADDVVYEELYEKYDNDRQRHEAIQEILAQRGYTILPLFLYDHSGITMSVGAFSCPWDSGQVGWIYAGPEEIKKVGAPPETVERQLKAEVEEYDDYLTGDCYTLCVDVFDAEGNRIESNEEHGYLGDDHAKKELESYVEWFDKSQTRETHGQGQTKT